jgi:CO dehydrogenase/acetyl-CoA synthase epsilon subunit
MDKPPLDMDQLFDLIHRKQADAMLEILESGEVTPQALNAINKFLADNSITGIRGKNKGLTALEKGLAAYDSDDNVTAFPARNT